MPEIIVTITEDELMALEHVMSEFDRVLNEQIEMVNAIYNQPGLDLFSFDKKMNNTLGQLYDKLGKAVDGEA